jgi:hypothetical protein
VTLDGNSLHATADVLFGQLNWKHDPFLLSKIRFKPPIIEMLAKEAVLEPALLALLKKLGLTNSAELLERLGVPNEGSSESGGANGEQEGDRDEDAGDEDDTDSDSKEDDLDESESEDDSGQEDAEGSDSEGDSDEDDTEEADSEDEGEEEESDAGDTGADEDGSSRDGSGTSDTEGSGSQTGSGSKHRGRSGTSGRKRNPGEGSRPFISYIGTHPDEEEDDPDGLDQRARIELEDKAITFIIEQEPALKRTSQNNRGFDLFEPGERELPVRWVEVKAMTGNLHDRPVCLSRAQFDCAWLHGEDYWLYIVEHAGEPTKARVLRIKDPAGQAKHFSFDRGWESIAQSDGANPEGPS